MMTIQRPDGRLESRPMVYYVSARANLCRDRAKLRELYRPDWHVVFFEVAKGMVTASTPDGGE